MRTSRAVALAAATATGLLLAGCTSSPSPSAGAAASTKTAASAPAAATSNAASSPAASCSLPNGQDLIERDDDPGASVIASEVGEVDLENCVTTLSEFQQTAGQSAGECTTIAWAKDNPGYDVNVVPAPPLKDVIESAGPGC